MAIIKWEPFDGIDQFLENLKFPPMREYGMDLAVDVYEENSNLIAKMNVPGSDPKKIKVSVEDNFLRVSGSSQEEKEEKGKKYYRKEIRSGAFERLISLPQNVQKDKVKAEFDNGVLKVILPKENNKKASRAVDVEIKK